MTPKNSNSIGVFVNSEYPAIARGKGIYLYDTNGKRYIDASGGPITCSLGHGVTEIAETMKAQAEKTAFVYRVDFTTPELEECCSRICDKTDRIMDKVFMVSGGSEATEIAIKLARKYHIENGNPSKFKIISRWLSYHVAGLIMFPTWPVPITSRRAIATAAGLTNSRTHATWNAPRLWKTRS